MFASTARKVVDRDPARALYDAVGRFLAEHRLGFDPALYAFAYRVTANPDAPLARTVAALTEGGVRLSERDIAALGGGAVGQAPSGDALERATALVAQTRSQMADFSGLMDRMRKETTGFGRDLAASVDALDPTVVPGIVDLTAAMLARVQNAEARLENATEEAAGLRAELEEARVDAREDPLTGLANRRALTEAFASRAATGAGCLAICDVDHFKQVNDRFGHAVGDRVLSAIAQTLAEACSSALVARYGGEEFAVLFDHADLADATAAIERARANVAGKRYRLRDDSTVLGTITFSGGVVAAAAGESFEDAFARADTLLYAAKNGGRNQVLN